MVTVARGATGRKSGGTVYQASSLRDAHCVCPSWDGAGEDLEASDVAAEAGACARGSPCAAGGLVSRVTVGAAAGQVGGAGSCRVDPKRSVTPFYHVKNAPVTTAL